MDAKRWRTSPIGRIETLLPIRLRYICFCALGASSLPLSLGKLPSLDMLLVVSVLMFCLCLLCRSRLLFYLFVIAIFLSNFIWHAEQNRQQTLPYASAKKTVSIQAQVIDFAKVDHFKTSFMVRLVDDCDHVQCLRKNGDFALPKGTSIMLSCYRCKTPFSLGQVWAFSVKLKPPRGSVSWRAFDYEKYAFARNIVAVGYLNETQSRLINADKSFHHSVRLALRDVITQAFPFDAMSASIFSSRAFLLALLVGDRSKMNSTTWKTFSQTGVNHLVAISGLHIGLVFILFKTFSYWLMSLILRLFCFVHSRFAADRALLMCNLSTFSMVVGFIAALCYALIAGFSLPTQRALLMLLVICIVKSTIWKISLFDALCCAVLCLLLVSPLSTMLAGFWLSIIAVSIIAMILKTNESSVFIQCRLACAMIPFSLLFFGHLPWVSPIANLVFIPIISFIVLPVSLLLLFIESCLYTLQVTVLLNEVWRLLDTILNLMWHFLVILEGWQTAMPLHFLSGYLIPNTVAKMLALGLLIGVLIMWRLVICRALICLTLVMVLFVDTQKQKVIGEFVVTTLDVGQGLAVVIETKEETILFDAGIKFLRSDSAEQTILPFLLANHVKPTRYIVISHGDNDHIGGFDRLVTRFPDANLLSNDLVVSQNQHDVQECYEKEWISAGVRFSIFPKVHNGKNSNNSSCVMKVSSQYGSILLPADIERNAERSLVKIYSSYLHADVLVVGHHGSRTSTTPSFLHQVNPKVAIVSAAYFSAHGHPHASVVNRLKNQNVSVFSTATSGSVQIQFLKDGFEAREYRAIRPRFWYSQP